MSAELLLRGNAREHFPDGFSLVQATDEHKPALGRVYEEVSKWLGSVPEANGQWQRPWPTPSERELSVNRSVDQGKTVVLLSPDDDVALTATINTEGEPWLWSPDDRKEPAIYISRLMVDRTWAKRRLHLGARLLHMAEVEAVEQDYPYLRLSVWSSNYKLQGYYAQRGFKGWDRMLFGYPACSLMEQRVENKSFRLWPDADEQDPHLERFATLSRPQSVANLSRDYLATWRNNFAPSLLHTTDAALGYPYLSGELLCRDPATGWLENQYGATGTGNYAVQLNECFHSAEYRLILQQYGLGQLVVNLLGTENLAIAGKEHPGYFVRKADIARAEIPADTKESYEQAMRRFSEDAWKGPGVLIAGTMIDAQKVILKDGTPIKLEGQVETLELRDDLPFAPLASDDLLRHGPTPVSARLTVPPATPGTVSQFKATVLKIPQGPPPDYEAVHLDDIRA